MTNPIAILLSLAIANYCPAPTPNTNIEPKINIFTEQAVLEKLSQSAPKLNQEVIRLAVRAYEKALIQGKVKNPVLTIIDFSIPSNHCRMWIFDMQTDNLVLKTYVAHGRNSGKGTVPYQFSNKMLSKESSLGTYITEDTYMGHSGYSLNLEGLEKDLNSNASNRRVVVHGAWYVEPSFIKSVGYAGCSWGCPAVPASLAKSIINIIKNGSVLFTYYPDRFFLSHSKYAFYQ
jgi:hypothetical protein